MSSVNFEENVKILMRDDIVTYCDVFKPSGSGKHPVLLMRTPYDKSASMSRTMIIDAITAASEGYAVVIQDVRGRHSSSGDFYTFHNEIDDGFDSIDWAASQSWSTGKVGMYGSSYVGATQWLAARSQHPALAAICPGVTASDYHEGWAWQGGAFELAFNLSWSAGPLVQGNWDNISATVDTEGISSSDIVAFKDNLDEGFRKLPLSSHSVLKKNLAPYYYDWIKHPEFDDYWRTISIEDHHQDISVPAFNIGGWHDIFLGGTLRNFNGMSSNGKTKFARGGQKLLIGPWVHGNNGILAGDYGFGTLSSRSSADLHGRALAYFDQWLKEDDSLAQNDTSVRIFVMGSNEWRDEDSWPLERAIDTPFYLHSKGGANSLLGDGVLSQTSPDREIEDSFLYNPQFPVPTVGGSLCCDEVFTKSGIYDQQFVEQRSDVLVYTSEAVTEDLEVTGPVKVTLYASSSAQDTDFTAKLVDVNKDGFARNLTDGIIRSRYRNKRTGAVFVEPGTIVSYEIDLWATSNVFLKGHKIRLEISSSNFPRFDRNLNTGGEIGEETNFQSALQKVYHSGQFPSHVTLPLIPK